MGVESAEDLAGFFDPDEFGTRFEWQGVAGLAPFNGINTTGAKILDDSSFSARVTDEQARIICKRADLPDVQQGDLIVALDAAHNLQAGDLVLVNDLHYKGDLLIIYYHSRY